MSISPAPKSYLALGDSYTIGEAVLENERWPMQLVHALQNEGIAFKTPEIMATTGWTTDELLKAVGERKFNPPYDLISLLIGVNNQYRGYSIETFEKELDQLIDFALSMLAPRGMLVLLSIPDWGVTPFAATLNQKEIALAIDQFNAVKAKAAQKRNLTFVNITPYSRKWGARPDYIAADGLHPSGKMYAAWAKKVLPYVMKSFRLQ